MTRCRCLFFFYANNIRSKVDLLTRMPSPKAVARCCFRAECLTPSVSSTDLVSLSSSQGQGKTRPTRSTYELLLSTAVRLEAKLQ